MSNSTRWTLLGVLVTVNVLANLVLRDGAVQIIVSGIAGLGVIAVIVDYLVRRRREN